MKTFSEETLKEYFDLTLSGEVNTSTIIENLINYILEIVATNGLTLSDYPEIDKFYKKYLDSVSSGRIVSQRQVNNIVDSYARSLPQEQLDSFPVYIYHSKPLWAFLRNCASIHEKISHPTFLQTVIQYLISYGERFIVTSQNARLTNIINTKSVTGGLSSSVQIVERGLEALNKLLGSPTSIYRIIKQSI